jgi:hypothetical protein
MGSDRDRWPLLVGAGPEKYEKARAAAISFDDDRTVQEIGIRLCPLHPPDVAIV